jgi:hypothetical protein
MDPQNMAQIRQTIEQSQREIAANARTVEVLTIIMGVFAAVFITWMLVSTWRREQHDKAARRVRDRLAQEADPEGWARRQERQAREAALIAEELAAMRRASWYGRLWSWWRQRLWPQP